MFLVVVASSEANRFLVLFVPPAPAASLDRLISSARAFCTATSVFLATGAGAAGGGGGAGVPPPKPGINENFLSSVIMSSPLLRACCIALATGAAA